MSFIAKTRTKNLQDTLFIHPHQRGSNQMLQRVRAPVTTVPNSLRVSPLAAHIPTSNPMDEGDEESDMEILSFDFDDEIVPPPSREVSPTPSEELPREFTPVSDAEVDSTQAGPESEHDRTSPVGDALPNEAACKLYHERRTVQYRSSSPLFLPSPRPTPSRVKIMDFADLSNEFSFKLPKDSPLARSTPCPVRQFLASLRRPCGHHCNTFYDLGIRTAEDVNALASMPADWGTIHNELTARGVTLMEWLYIKAGLEAIQRGLENDT